MLIKGWKFAENDLSAWFMSDGKNGRARWKTYQQIPDHDLYLGVGFFVKIAQMIYDKSEGVFSFSSVKYYFLYMRYAYEDCGWEVYRNLPDLDLDLGFGKVRVAQVINFKTYAPRLGSRIHQVLELMSDGRARLSAKRGGSG